MARKKASRIMLIGVALVAAAFFAKQVPELVRYIKIESM
jgi:hypothetical protein